MKGGDGDGGFLSRNYHTREYAIINLNFRRLKPLGIGVLIANEENVRKNRKNRPHQIPLSRKLRSRTYGEGPIRGDIYLSSLKNSLYFLPTGILFFTPDIHRVPSAALYSMLRCVLTM